MNQTVRASEDDHIAKFEVVTNNTSISWSSSKTGTSRFAAMTHKSGAWTSFTMTETPDGGRTTQTMATLNRDAAIALYQHLHAVFGQELPPARRTIEQRHVP